MKKYGLIVAIAAVAGLTACTETSFESTEPTGRLVFQPTVTYGDWDVTRNWQAMAADDVARLTTEVPLFLHTTVEPRAVSAATRATLINSYELPTSLPFGVSGYRYTSASALSSEMPNFFYNAKVDHDGVSWMSSESFYIPTAGEKLAFYAYWPYDATGSTLSNSSAAGPLTVSYEVNTTDVTAQQELLTASVTELDYDDRPSYRVPLTFQHALTAIRVVVGDDVAPGNVRHVALKNVGVKGTHTVGDGWTVTETGDIDIDFTAGGTADGFNTSTLTEDTELVGSEKTILTIPQVFTAADTRACLYFEINDGTKTYPLYYYLQGSSWQAGTQVTYRVSTSSINVVRPTIEYPANWGGDAFSVKTAYTAATDTVGVFAVDAAGKVAIANAYYIYNGTLWQQEPTKDTLFYRSDYEYFAYYPYRKTLTGAPAKDASVGRSLTADAFFADVITGWTISADQSTAKKLTANDLQVSKGVKVSGTKLALRFPMQHQMGLAKITLGEKTFAGYTTFYLDTDPDYTWAGSAPITVHASPQLADGKQAYMSNETQYYYIVRPATATTFTCGVSGTTDTWANTTEAITIYSNKCGGFTAEVGGEYTDLSGTEEYHIEIGDLLYADGALSHPDELIYSTDNYPGRTMVGMVAYLAVNGAADPVCENKKHGMAIALKEAGYARWGTKGENENDTYYPDMNMNSGKVTAAQVIKDYAGKTRMDYVLTDGHTTHKAFEVIRDYDVSTAGVPGCTGWYMGTVGQWYEVIKSMGNFTCSLRQWQTTNARTKINAYLAKAGKGNYEELHIDNNGLYWTSTEWNADWTWYVQFSSTEMRIASDNELDNKNLQHYVRPFLSF